MPGSLGPWPVTAAGSKGHPVWTLHDLLRARGHAVAVDGIFGPRTDAAVKAFQTSKGLTANGTVDPTTWKALIVQVKKGASGDAVRGAGGISVPQRVRRCHQRRANRRRFRPANRRRGARISTRPVARHSLGRGGRHRRPDHLAGAGQRHAVGLAAPTASCRLASARVPRRAKALLVQRKNRGGTIIHRRRLPFRWGHVVGDFNGKKVFRSSAAVVRCCGVRGYVGSRLNRGNDRKIRTLIATGRRRGRHIASLLAVKDRARAP